MSINYQNALRFNYTEEEIMKITDDSIKKWENEFNKMGQNQIQDINYENTIQPFMNCDSELGTIVNNICFYSSVSDKKELREASLKAEEKYDQFYIDQSMREDLYQAVQKFVSQNQDYDYHTQEQNRYVQHKLRDFIRNGLDKDQQTKIQIKELQKQIADLERKANSNINEDVTKIKFSVQELQGIPQDILDKFENVENEQDYKWVSLKYPDLLPTMKFACLESTRKKMDFAYQNKCAEVNTTLLEELVVKRQQLAELLGYSSISEYILEIRMAKNSVNVQEFEQSLILKLKDKGQEELKGLIALKAQHTGVGQSELQSWDMSFYCNLMKEEQFQLDEEMIKQYFPVEHVIRETLGIYEELLGLRFKKEKAAHVWHRSVELYSVYDEESQNLVGQFYMDLYPRDGKYSHAAAFPLIKRAIINNQVVLPVCAMVCNFNESPNKTVSSLLNFGEVETFFHEFGHIMHNICSTATLAAFSGTSVERDFVEMPSQMLENWCWDKHILKRLSKHHLTQEQLSDQLILKKIQIKNLNNALFTLRQVQLGVFDHLLHTANDLNLLSQQSQCETTEGLSIVEMRKTLKKEGLKVDSADLIRNTKEAIALVKYHPATNFAANFGHLLGGYQAQYYGYLWSQVYSCDLFSLFLDHGIMDKALGKKYRAIILGPGGSIDSIQLIKKFLGRDPNDQAFLQQNGFI